MKKRIIINSLFTLCFIVALCANVWRINDSNEKPNTNLKMLLAVAQANAESVTCSYDCGFGILVSLDCDYDCWTTTTSRGVCCLDPDMNITDEKFC